ncbi:hypothetical protein GGX14DRAFT_317401, partial [Mycena pura]
TIIAKHAECSTYTLDLPNQPEIFNVFHSSELEPYVENDAELFPSRALAEPAPPGVYDFGEPDEDEWLVDSIIAHRWSGERVDFQVRWNLGDMTWEPFNSVKLLRALDDYFALHGVKRWQQLP